MTNKERIKKAIEFLEKTPAPRPENIVHAMMQLQLIIDEDLKQLAKRINENIDGDRK